MGYLNFSNKILINMYKGLIFLHAFKLINMIGKHNSTPKVRKEVQHIKIEGHINGGKNPCNRFSNNILKHVINPQKAELIFATF